MEPMIIADGTITDSSGPIAMLMSNSGTDRAKPEIRVGMNTPFRAFGPPPMIITTKNGLNVLRIKS